jgi:large subunit ribosomal protein L7/L12
MTKEEIIKALDAMPALELSQFVKELQEHWGVSAAVAVAAPAGGAAPAAGGAAPAAAAPVEEQTEFTVFLKEIGPNKINVIKVVREITALGLKEAKDLVESAPKPVKENVAKAEAQQLKEKIEATGAVAEIK